MDYDFEQVICWP